MVRLGLLLALLASPAKAGCFGPPAPAEVDFEGGRTVVILAQTARDVTYRSILPDGSASVATMREGLFLTTTTHAGATLRYDWIDPLPRLADLTPGDSGHLRADMVVEHAARSFFATDYKVLRAETLTVQGCSYPVLVVEKTDTLDGQTQATTTLWLSPALKFPLRTEATAGGKRFAYRATALR
jgi:hypothetical protein